MRKSTITAALAVAALPVAANASFVITYPSAQPVPTADPGANNFATELASFGITSFASTGASLVLDAGGLVTFEYFGKESLLSEVFTAGGLNFSPPGSPVTVNNFASPVNLGTFSFTTANFNPTFYSVGVPGLFTPGSAFFGIGLPAGLNARSGSVQTNSVWLLFDDNAVPDDNHDDLIIRATFAVPEPSTWAMMILGFGVIGLVMRRRTQQRVSLV